MKLNLQRGFTLIELLVVIAIIGILSSVVLASLNSARDKGADAAIRGNLAGMRAQAELVYDGANSYAGVAADPGIVRARDAADNANGATVAAFATSSTDVWAASAQLKSNPALWYCVDSTGNATTTTLANAGTILNLNVNLCL